MATLAQKVRFLSDPHSYPHKPATVESIETHMSWVFLAGDLVYKFKKPMRLPFLDFRTLGAREFNCAEELRLNERLAKETYRNVVAVTETATGELRFDGNGTVVEWLVEMNRLPKGMMLDAQILAGAVQRKDVIMVAERLAHFYHSSTPQIADGALYIEHLEKEHAVSRKILTLDEFAPIDTATIALINEVEQQFKVVQPEIEARIADGRIVEGHGDLRPEHVYIGKPVQIIDCLEFDRSMRILDPYDEINYLGLECAYMGEGWMRSVMLETLEKFLGNPPSPSLMAFYSGFRAVLRARICMAHLLDTMPLTPEIWPERARMYLEMAQAENINCHQPEDGGSILRRAGA